LRYPHRTTGSARFGAELRSFPRQFWLLAGGSFFYLVGIYLCFPFETLYLNESLGMSMTMVGVLIGTMAFIGLPFQFPGGAATDRIGRRPVLALAVAGSVTLCAGLAFARTVWQVALVIFVEAAFGWPMYLTSSHAMIADLVPPERRAEALSIVRTAINAGAATGPLLAGIILAGGAPYRTSFLTGAAVCALFLVFVLTTIRETRPVRHRRPETPVHDARRSAAVSTDAERPAVVSTGADDDGPPAALPDGRRGYGHVLRDRRFLIFCAVMLLPLYALGQLWVTFPIAMRNEHGITPGTWGVLVTVFSATAAVLQYPLIRGLRDRDPLRVLSVAAALLTGSLSGAVFAPDGWPAYVLVVTASLGFLLLMPVGTGVVSRLAPVDLRGRYLGVWTFIFLCGYSVGPLLGGLVLDRLGTHGAYLVVAAAGLTGAALLFALSAAYRLRARPAAAE
jgi:MFS family permease